MSTRTFHYAARGAAGEPIAGTMEAEDTDAVLAALRTRPLFVTAIRPAPPLVPRGTGPRSALVPFFRAFATMIRAGVPMRRALLVAAERASDRRFREVVDALRADVEQGRSLGDAMARRGRAFPPLAVAMIDAGEAGGVLDTVLERLADLTERDAALRKRLRAAAAYPAVVLSAAGALVVFLLVRIVPLFGAMFAAFRVTPPPATLALLAVSRTFADPRAWVAAACSSALLALAFAAALRRPGTARLIDAFVLRFPVVGPLRRRAVSARIARLLGTLVASGMDVLRAVGSVRPATGSAAFGALLDEVDAALRAGAPLSLPLGASPLVDPLLVALVRAGEETGRLDVLLGAAATAFETDVEAGIAAASAIVEPALVAILGAIVALIVFSVYLPLYSLIGSLSK